MEEDDDGRIKTEPSLADGGSQETKQMTKEMKYVLAIDIGTAYSGYAYNDNIESERDPLSITLNTWQRGSPLSLKAPTIILFDKEKNFHSFGNAASKAYATALQKGQHHLFICVKEFKMSLYHEKKVSNSFILKDTEGRSIDAMMVFTNAIKSLKTDAMADMSKRLGDINEDDVTFILTVPAIWREPSKQFMRMAAEKAGIKSESLTIALESEVAALYCRHLELRSAFGSGDQTVIKCFQPGGKYMIMDLGGGTVDTVVHAIDENGDIIELYKSSGGPWGGENVNVNFRSYISTTYGEEAARKFKETRPLDNYELEQDFEIKKRDLNTENEADVRIRVPGHLKILANRPVEKNTVDHLYIGKTEFESFFDPLVKEIIQHIRFLLHEVGEIPLVFLVGGFSESLYVQERFKQEFGDVKILVPRESGMAVLRGAVMYGFNPKAVKMRRCRFTYGVRIRRQFDKAVHPLQKLFFSNGKQYCRDVFYILVHESKKIQFDHEKEDTFYSEHSSDAEDQRLPVSIPIYASSTRHPSYTDDPGCSKIGDIRVNPPEGGWPKEVNNYTVKCKFGRTELFVKVYDTTNNRQYDATFDMLG